MAHENDGHRERLRQRMIKEGLAAFEDHEVLEMLLYQSIPRRDTNKLAHTLLKKFGGFAGVLNASPQQLMLVEGISEVTACNICMLKEVFRRYKLSDCKRIPLRGVGSIIEFGHQLLEESYTERLVAVYVDNSTSYIYRDEFTSDNKRCVSLDPQKIVTTALRLAAAGVILFHCHVDGECTPSDQDFRFTERLSFALASVEIVLLEHVVFNEEKYYSFFLHGDMDRIHSKFKNFN